MIRQSAGSLCALALALSCAQPAGAAATADLILSLHSRYAEGQSSTQAPNARLLGDMDLRRPARFHLDLEWEETSRVDLYEAYGEWAAGAQRFRLGRFQVPFGIYNRSELYYVGLINAPLVKYYPSEEPSFGDSENGVGYLGSAGSWQVEGALTSTAGEGSIRVQRFAGPVILGVNALRERVYETGTGSRGSAHFFGLDLRFSRPTFILRGELVTGRVPGGSPDGFYLDALYHPAALHRVTFVGRTEAVHGQPGNGRRYQRQTIGFKWELIPGTALAVNELFNSPRTREGRSETAVFLWYTRRL